MRMSSLMAAILLLGVSVRAIDSSLEINQYGHRSWTFAQAGLKSYPKSIAQTRDGYLWFGGEFGLLRFDGARFVPWRPPAGARLPSESVVKLLAGRDGSLWIGTTLGLARWKDGRLTTYRGVAADFVTALAEDHEGTLWVGTDGGLERNAKLCAVRDGDVRCEGNASTLGQFVISLYEDSKGSLWVGAATGVWRWTPSPASAFPVGYAFPEVRSITEAGGEVLLAANRGVYRVGAGQVERLTLPDHVAAQTASTALLQDRDGGLWIGTQNQGLIHRGPGGTDRFDRTDGLSGNFITSLLEDHEGNVWVATLNGVDRFKATAVVRISRRQGLSSDTVLSVLAARDGRVWLGTSAGLNQWSGGRITRYGARGSANDFGSALAEDAGGRLLVSVPQGRAYVQGGPFQSVRGGSHGFVWSMVQDAQASLWLSDQDRGLVQLRKGKVARIIPWAELGGGMAQALAGDPVDGGLWLGFFQGGISYLKDGRVEASYTPANGLGLGPVNGLFVDRDRALWAATQNGLSRVKGGRIATLTTKNGLPCQTIHWVIDDEAGALWLRTSCGLVQISRAALDAWVVNPNRVIDLATYDETDGLPGHSEQSPYNPRVSRALDGRIWFATYAGVAVIDPQALPRNAVVPPVHIEQVSADGIAYDASAPLELPPLVRDLRIDYTALSLVVSTKVQFRYKLEGRDEDWVDGGNRRQAFYTDLRPRTYRFRVIASNNDGVWNETGDVLEFSIKPTFVQTVGFKAGLGVFVAGLLLGAYRLRLRQIGMQMSARFEERLGERTRIAQDLHDTLLQGNLSASMQLHVLAERVADPAVKLKLERILKTFSEMTEEGRQAVQDLRGPTGATDDLELVLAREAERLKGDQPVEVRLTIHGRKRRIHALVRDECYRIGREALANAFRHAQATRIDVTVEYTSDHLRLRIRDNGRGIAPEILEGGRPGHWGLQGIRERAERIGATVKLQSQPNAGTGAELIVPGWYAFMPAAAGPTDARDVPTRWLGSRLRP
jgi:signal transduction histidine kinase/ligand-binding sensor domain-containing protein